MSQFQTTIITISQWNQFKFSPHIPVILLSIQYTCIIVISP